MASCKFCKDLEWLKDKSRDLKKKENINTIYRAGLYFRRTTSGEMVHEDTYNLYTLNFCPVCGTKLVNAIRQKKKL